MKKLILLIIAMVLAVTITANESSGIKNKGSSQSVSISKIMPGSLNSGTTTAVTPALWIQQNSSVNSMPRLGDVTMNNTQNISLEGYAPEIAQSSFFCSPRSIHFEPYRLALETRVEVSEIATSEIAMNYSNTQIPTSSMVQWRSLDETNKNSSVFTSTLVAQKIWPTSAVDNNVATFNMAYSSIGCVSYNMSSSFFSAGI